MVKTSHDGPLVRGFETLGIAGAEVLFAGATAKATEIGKPMVLAVMDAGGHLLAFRRMDGAPAFCIDVALDKAHTAVVSEFRPVTGSTTSKMTHRCSQAWSIVPDW